MKLLRALFALSVSVLIVLADVTSQAAQQQDSPPVVPLWMVQIKLPASKDEAAFMAAPFTCTPDVAEFLATYRELYLDGIETLTPEVAKLLAKQKPGGILCLQKLTTLSDEAAAGLVAYQGKMLILRGLKTLSTKAAKSLADCKAKTILLTGIETLPKGAADALKAREGIDLPSSVKITP
jgi:hypothetical protein